MSMSPQEIAMLEAHGAPYPPTIANIGGRPTVIPDIPVCAVLILLYAGAAAGHMATYQLNNRKGHKFFFSAPLFGFCMARILTCSLRMAEATHPTNVSLGIAANIFLAAGILIIYIVNLHFAQRILRARQPALGWSLPLRILFFTLYALTAIFLILLITFIVYQSYTLKPHWHTVTRNIQLGSSTYFVILTASPLLIVGISYILPVSPNAQHFGEGSMATKALVVVVSSLLCTLSAGFKCGITWPAPRPMDNPAWYQSKACLYTFYFMLEIIIIYWLLAARVDRRFHVPNGSSKRKSYEPPADIATETASMSEDDKASDV